MTRRTPAQVARQRATTARLPVARSASDIAADHARDAARMERMLACAAAAHAKAYLAGRALSPSSYDDATLAARVGVPLCDWDREAYVQAYDEAMRPLRWAGLLRGAP